MRSLESKFASALPVSASLPGEAGRIVAELLGSQPRAVKTIRQGLMTFKVRVTTQRGERVIVRFYPPRRGSVVNQEPDLLARCRIAGIPVPQVIGDSRTGPAAELAYVAYYMIEGATLSSRLPTCTPSQISDLARDLAGQLSKFDAIEFKGAGEIVNSITAQELSWESFVDNSMRSGLEAVRRHAMLDSTCIDQLSRIVDRGIQGPVQGMHSLVWGDINFGNILVDSDYRIVGLVDFESCLSGDPLATLGYCLAAQGRDAFVAQLLRTWPDQLGSHELETVLVYVLLRALRLARYAHLPLPTGYPRDPLTEIFPGITLALDELSRRP